MEDRTRSGSLLPSWLLVRPQVLERSWKWLARGEGPGDMGVWARPGFFGGMGGGWPLSARGMMGDFTPGEMGLVTLAGVGAAPGGGLRQSLPVGELGGAAGLAPPCWPVKRDSAWVSVLRASCFTEAGSGGAEGGVGVEGVGGSAGMGGVGEAERVGCFTEAGSGWVEGVDGAEGVGAVGKADGVGGAAGFGDRSRGERGVAPPCWSCSGWPWNLCRVAWKRWWIPAW